HDALPILLRLRARSAGARALPATGSVDVNSPSVPLRMGDSVHLHLSRRESQIMDAIYQLGEASVAEVVERMPDQPGYNTVRNTMAILERKGHLRHRRVGLPHLYDPPPPEHGRAAGRGR